jgi:hypothetical protein
MRQVQLADKILSTLDDNLTFYGSDDFLDAIQDGYDEVVAYTGCIEKATSLTLSATTTYYDFSTLIPDFISIIAIWNSVTKRYLSPVSLIWLERQRPDWESASGSVDYFWPINYKYVAFFRQRADKIYVFYRAQAPILSTFTSILIPDKHMNCLQDISTAYLLEQQHTFESAVRHIKSYIKEIELFRCEVQGKQNAGRLEGLR